MVQRRALCVFVTLFCLALLPRVAAAEPVTIVAFGDSLTAGYGLPAEAAFPAKLEQALKARGMTSRS